MLSVKGSIAGPSQGSLQDAIDYVDTPDDTDLEYLRELYALCQRVGIRFEVAFAQWCDETDVGTSDLWREKRNPAGIGALTDGTYVGLDYATMEEPGKQAARAQLVHLWLYIYGTTLPAALAPYQTLDPRWNDAIKAGNAGKAKTLAFLARTWADNPNYAVQIAAHANAAFPALSDGALPVATHSTVVPGLPGGALITDYPIDTDKMIPASNTYQRPGIIASLPRNGVQHGTANDNSLRKGEVSWLVDQRAGNAQVSFHACSDDTGVSVAVPANEVTWQAADGGGRGNMNGFSCEMIENLVMWRDPVRRARAIYITADFMGRVAARIGIEKPEYHWTYNYANPPELRHHCPQQLMFAHPEYLPLYEQQWYASKADELARMGGTPGIKAGDRMRALKAVQGRVGWGLDQPVVMQIAPADVGVVEDDGTHILVHNADGMDWFNFKGVNGSAWVPLQDFEYLKEKPPVPPTVYAKPLPVQALLYTDIAKYDTATGVVSLKDGTDFIFVADVIEVTAPTAAVRQYASTQAPKLRADLVKGSRFVGAWLVKAADGGFWYVGPAPTWERILYKDAAGKEYTKRVSDAPLLPGSEHIPAK